ncbi:MAG TPA: hypothetical protein VGD30_04190 [Telluria sp.]
MKNTKSIATITAGLVLSLSVSHAFAQSAAKPAREPSAKRSGPGDRVMSKDELRACMALKDSNDRGAAELERSQEKMSKERSELARTPEAASPDPKVDVDPFRKAAEEADAKIRAHGIAVRDWNARMTEFEAKVKDMRHGADRARTALKREQAALTAAEPQLLANQTETIAAYERAVADYNKKVEQRGSRNVDWNKRNADLLAVQERLNESQRKWTAECGNRRFREDDETAIKAGK